MEPIPSKLQSINQVTRELVQCQSIEELVSKALKAVREQLNVQVASIFLFTKDGVIRRVGIDGVDKEGYEIDESWFPVEEYEPGQSFSGKAVPRADAESEYGEPNYSNDLQNYPGIINRDIYEEKLGNLKRGISVPLNGGSSGIVRKNVY